MTRSADPGGVVLWEGPSRLDGKPTVAIATGLKGNSANSKTGAMVQTWILRQDILPSDAVRSGDDASVCGDCIHRVVGGKGTCYVNVPWGVNNVWKFWKKGNYPQATLELRRRMRETNHIRFGSYGDPVAVPKKVWKALLPDNPLNATGYTHAWRNSKSRDYKSFLMASVESDAERVEAKHAGWRTFQVVPLNRDIPKGTTWCPSDKLNPRKNKIPCEACGLCNGARYESRDVSIFVHGVSAKTFGSLRARNPNLPIIRQAGLKYDPVLRVPRELHTELKEHVKGGRMKPWLADAIREKLEREKAGT